MDNRKFQSAASATPPSAPGSPSSGYPTNGNPGTGTPATLPGEYWFHKVGEELRTVITDAGITPSDADLGQLSRAIKTEVPVSRSSNTILAVADIGKFFLATSTFTQTLTAAATLGVGWFCDYRNDGTGVITIDPNAAETVDGATTIALNPAESITLFCDGSNFKTMGRRARVKAGGTTRDLSAASGTQAITGVGFKPRKLSVTAVVDSTTQLSLGFSDGITEGGFKDGNGAAAGTYRNSGWLIYIGLNDVAYNRAVVQSFDTDGFTLSWTKFSTPTGTASIYYVAEE